MPGTGFARWRAATRWPDQRRGLSYGVSIRARTSAASELRPVRSSRTA